MFDLLKKFSETPGPSGFEEKIREVISKEIEPFVDEICMDNFGNLIAKKKGKRSDKRIMIAAHMDQPSLIVEHIEDNGLIRFAKLGGIDSRILPGQWVKIITEDKEIPGIIGSKPPHLIEDEDKKKPFTDKMLLIDVGVSEKDHLNEMGITVGDPVVFHRDTIELNDNTYLGKAFDNRVGCLVMIEVLKRLQSTTLEYDVYAVATREEEVGLRGGMTSTFKVNPTIAFAIDTSPANHEKESRIDIRKGPVIRLLDSRGMITPIYLKNFMINIAKENNIPYQLLVGERSSTDASAISVTREGVVTSAIQIPVRYIHSPGEVVCREDIEAGIELMVNMLKKIPEII